MKDFIENDIEDDEDSKDEDYDANEGMNSTSKIKNNFQMTNEFIFFRDIMSQLANKDQEYYNYLMGNLNDQSKTMLASLIAKAESSHQQV
jgi:hypothetical protein